MSFRRNVAYGFRHLSMPAGSALSAKTPLYDPGTLLGQDLSLTEITRGKVSVLQLPMILILGWSVVTMRSAFRDSGRAECAEIHQWRSTSAGRSRLNL